MQDKQSDPARSKDRIHPQAVARMVSDLAKRDAVFVIDTGLNTLWSGNWIRQSGEQRIIGSFNNGAAIRAFEVSDEGGSGVESGSTKLISHSPLTPRLSKSSCSMSAHSLGAGGDLNGAPLRLSPRGRATEVFSHTQ